MRTVRFHGSIGKKLSKILVLFKRRLLNIHVLTSAIYIAVEINDKLIVLFLFSQRKFFVIEFSYQTVEDFVQLGFQRVRRCFLVKNRGEIIKDFSMKHCSFHNILQYRPGLAVFMKIPIVRGVKFGSLKINGFRPLLSLLFNKTGLISKMFKPLAHLSRNNAFRIGTE